MLELFQNAIKCRYFPPLSVVLLNSLGRMSNDKEVERDVYGMEVGGADGVIVCFEDDMGLDTTYGTQLGIKHVL